MHIYHNPLLLQSKYNNSFVLPNSCFAIEAQPLQSKKSKPCPVKKELYVLRRNCVTNLSGIFSSCKPYKPEKSQRCLHFSTSFALQGIDGSSPLTSVGTTTKWRHSKPFPSTRLPHIVSENTEADTHLLANSKQRVKQTTESFPFVSNVPEIKLFVNLLMKHGKKAKALHILEIAALLFIKSISKTDLCLKPIIDLQVQRKKVSKKIGVLQGNSQYTADNLYKQKITVDPSFMVFLHCYRSTVAKEQKKQGKKAYLCKSLDKNTNFSSLDAVLKDFYVEGKTFANSIFKPKRFLLSPLAKQIPNSKGIDFDKKKPVLAFFSSAPIIKTVFKDGNRTRFLLRQRKENNKRFWYINQTPDRWHQLSDAQKNTLLFALYTAISNVKPPLEVRSKRVGGSNRQIPAAVSENRQRGIAIRWIIESANSEKVLSLQATQRKKNSNTYPLFCISLAGALKNAFYKKGPAFQKRNLWVETAQANRAFLRYRWW